MAFSQAKTGTLGLTLVRVDAGMLWSEFEVTGNSTGPASTKSVDEGDFIAITAPGAGLKKTVTIRHRATNNLMGTWSWEE